VARFKRRAGYFGGSFVDTESGENEVLLGPIVSTGKTILNPVDNGGLEVKGGGGNRGKRWARVEQRPRQGGGGTC